MGGIRPRINEGCINAGSAFLSDIIQGKITIRTEFCAKGEIMNETTLGKIEISKDVIADIVNHILKESYGVTGIVGTGLRSNVSRLLGKPGHRKGIVVNIDGDDVSINIHIASGIGVNLAEVAANIKSAIVYQIEKLTGLKVSGVNIHIDEVKTPKP